MGVESIGNNILRLRRNKGVTQEVLAEFIGVTKTSVSKWETGATLPDIQMLPLLASYFEVSVDTLIDYVPMLNREQIRFHYHRLAEAFADTPFPKVLSECEGMIKKYYSCYPFLKQMAVLLLNHLNVADTTENRERALKLSFEICEHILADCQDMSICKMAVSIKGLLNLQQGRADLVIQEIEEDVLNAESIDDMGTLLAMAYLTAGDLEKAEKAAQIGMYRKLMNLINYGEFLLQAKADDIAYCQLLLKRLDDLMEIFCIKDLHPNTAAVYEYLAASYLAGQISKQMLNTASMERKESFATANNTAAYSKEGECSPPLEEAAFRHLEKYVSAVRQLFADNIRLHGDNFFTCLDDWFEELELGTSAVRSESSIRESVLQELQNPIFASLKNQERLKKLMEEIQNA